jgi:acetolactate synthase-1/2/3 large subunit
VEIEIPPETLADMAEIELLEPGKFPASPVDLKAVQEAVELLSSANRPVIWAGGGVHSSRAWQELLEVAELLQAPVITTAEGKGAISDRHYLSIGVSRGLSPGQVVDSLREYFVSCDVALAVGTRFATAWPPVDQKVIQIDIDEDEIGRNHSNTTGIVGDAKVVLSQLLAELRNTGKPRPSVQRDSEPIRADRLDLSKQIEPLGSYLRALRDACPMTGCWCRT